MSLNKNPIKHFNKVFENRLRLGVMSILMVNNEINFNDLKELLDATDGNLASHLKTLESSEYITVKKGFIGRKTNTVYKITSKGETAFKEHLEALEVLVQMNKNE